MRQIEETTPPSYLKRVVMKKDISNGQEKYPISVFNYENEQVIRNFEYVTQCSIGEEWKKINLSCKEVPCCDCAPGNCSTDKCICRKSSTVKIKDGKIANIEEVHNNAMERILIECREECACKRDCQNWITSKQIQFPVELEYFDKKGFGVRLKSFASQGQFFGEYVGEIIGDKERDDVSYQFDVTVGPKKSSTNSVIDAKSYGNVTRFVNHSCDPCLSVFVFIRSSINRVEYPQLGFFFLEDAIPGQELTVSYGSGYWKNVYYHCLCGFSNCLKPPKTKGGKLIDEVQRLRDQEKRQKEITSVMVAESKLCEERLEMLRQGRSMDDVLQHNPEKQRAEKKNPVSKKRVSTKGSSYGLDDRCLSPLVQGRPIVID